MLVFGLTVMRMRLSMVVMKTNKTVSVFETSVSCGFAYAKVWVRTGANSGRVFVGRAATLREALSDARRQLRA